MTTTHATVFAHDPNGAVIMRTDAMSQTTAYNLDALGRPQTIDYPGVADDVDYTYDDVGNRRTMSDATGDWRYDYDQAYRVQRVVYTPTASAALTVAVAAAD